MLFEPVFLAIPLIKQGAPILVPDESSPKRMMLFASKPLPAATSIPVIMAFGFCASNDIL